MNIMNIVVGVICQVMEIKSSIAKKNNKLTPVHPRSWDPDFKGSTLGKRVQDLPNGVLWVDTFYDTKLYCVFIQLYT